MLPMEDINKVWAATLTKAEATEWLKSNGTTLSDDALDAFCDEYCKKDEPDGKITTGHEGEE